jgi:hypothetical protein
MPRAMPHGSSAAALAEAIDALRFFGALPRLLRRPIEPASVRRELAARRAGRAAGFLALARAAIYGAPSSPYARLLALAGCAYGDLSRLVEREGLEGALGELLRRGVYLTGDELKGRTPVVRGSVSFSAGPDALRNPASGRHLWTTSSGSRGLGTMVALDLRSVHDQALNSYLELEARGALRWRHAAWRVPGGAQLTQNIRFALCGASIERSFTPIDPGEGLHPRYRWSDRALRWALASAGARLPPTEHVPLDDPEPILRWMAEVLAAGGVPHLLCYSSAGALLCRAAVAAGIDVAGAELTVGGEPVTEARLAAVAGAGVRAFARYGCTEAGGVLAVGCLAPRSAGELHFFDELRAVIQAGTDGAAAGLPPRTLLVTSLRATTPLVLLNASLGDEADLGARDCGCPFERLGWSRHIERLRSFEKLTLAGMSLADADLIRLLEEVLPERFGGGANDWQLVEDEAPDGAPRLALVASARIGALDEAAVREQVLAWIGRGRGIERITALLYRDGGYLGIVRREPFTTSGKVAHLHTAHSRPR